MNKKYAVILVSMFFIVLSGVGTMKIVKGNLPFESTFLQLSGTMKRLLYLPIQEDIMMVSGTFDMNPNVYVPKNDPKDKNTENKQEVSKPNETQQQPVQQETVKKNVDLDLSNTTGYLIVGDKLLQMCTTHEDSLHLYADNLNRLKSRLPNTDVISMVVPNSFPFYAPSQYVTSDVNQRVMIDRMYSQLYSEIKTVDAYSAINEYPEDYNYFRTDHHWTAKGAYRGYTALCETMNITPLPLPSKPSGVFTTYVGATYKTLQQYPQAQVALQNPDYVEYYIPTMEYEAYYYQDATMQNPTEMKVIQTNLSAADDRYLVFLEGLRPLIHISTQRKNGESILIIKDSYANALVPFLLEHYEDIYVVDFRNFNAPNLPDFDAVEFVEKHKIDQVLLVNYPYVPNDYSHSEWIGKMIR